MGSSTRNIQKKIKNIIQSSGKDNIDDNLNEIVFETLKLRKNKSFFYSDEFGNAIMGGVSILNSIKSGNLPEIKDEIDLLADNTEKPLIIQKILEEILDNMDVNGDAITDELILRAFKVTMAETLLDETLSINGFVELFVKASLYLLILEDTHEANIDEFDFVKIDEIENNFKSIASDLVDHYLGEDINKFVNNKIEFSCLVESIVELKSKLIKDGQ